MFSISKMFARFTRLPARRYLHTSSHSTWQQRSRLVNTTLGVSVVTVTYFAWRLTSDKNRIALDSALPAQAGEQTPSKVNVVNKPKFTLTSVAASDNMETPNVPPTIPESPAPEEADPPSDSDVAEKPDEGSEGDAGDSGQGGAYNPVTGEINWDCPCLGGMAHGPCGPQFREAFSCFIFSEEEPKGINCIDKFKNMQTCFREHPELYGDEIMDDDEDQDPLPELEGGVPSPVYASESEESKTREAVDTPPITQTNTLTVSQTQQDKSLASSS